MRNKSWLAVAIIFLLTLAACSKPDNTTPVTSPAVTTPAAASPQVISPPPTAATPAAKPATSVPQPVSVVPSANPVANVQGGGPTNVLIHGSAFDPSILTVAAGTTVIWTNKDDVAHDIKGDLPGTFSGLAQQNGGTFSFTFTKPGTFNYSCDLHDCMIGTVIVK